MWIFCSFSNSTLCLLITHNFCSFCVSISNALSIHTANSLIFREQIQLSIYVRSLLPLIHFSGITNIERSLEALHLTSMLLRLIIDCNDGFILNAIFVWKIYRRCYYRKGFLENNCFYFLKENTTLFFVRNFSWANSF